MRRLVIAALVAGAAFVGIPAANAVCVHSHSDGSVWVHSYACESQSPSGPSMLSTSVGNSRANSLALRDGPGWVGTCRITVVNDTTPDGTLGGQNVWNGQVNVAVAASTPGATVSAASCSIKVNGGSESTTLTATAAGPVAVGAGRATFQATVDATVEICTDVTTSSNGAQSTCATLTTTPVCPDQLCGDGALLDQVSAAADAFAPLVCPALAEIAPIANNINTGALYIDPATGDTYVNRAGRVVMQWDCPPYA